MSNNIIKLEEIVARLNRKHRWKGNILQMYAEKLVMRVVNEEDVIKIDMTQIFLKELVREIINKEIIKIQINAKPRLGKSTIGILLGKYIFDLLCKYYPNYTKDTTFGVWNIARDESEFIGKMRDPKLMYNIIITDERNAMDETGENVTVEKAQKEMFSDVQAGRYVHTISISPEHIIDNNTDIRLIVRNKEKGVSHCRLFYRLKSGWVLIGKVDLNVMPLITNWLKVEERFMRKIKDNYDNEKLKAQDSRYIQKWRERDFYIDYMYRKYEKMELMNKEGIMRERELAYAEIFLEVTEKCKKLVKVLTISNLKRVTMNYVETAFKSRKIPYSMIGSDKTSERVLSVLSMYRSIYEINQSLVGLRSRFFKKKIVEEDYLKQKKSLEEVGEELMESIKLQLEEWERYAYLNQKYHTILK